MAEEDSGQEKSEEPTARRIEKAREEGQVPRSKELATTAVLVIGAAGLIAFGPWMADYMNGIARYGFVIEREAVFDTSVLGRHLGASLEDAVYALAPWMILVLIAAIAGPLGIGGWLFSTKAITPKLDRLDPLKGLKRMFSMNSLVELVKAWAKVLVVGAVAWLVLAFFFEESMNLQRKALEPSIKGSVDIILWSVLALCCSTLVIAIADVPWQIYSHTKKLRMSMQEIKDEYKETEGKPEVKAKIRQLQREVAQRRMMADVPDADVVITNPTHYAVALKYSADAMTAPLLLAKGTDQVAQKIQEIAREHNVPRMQAPPLARALYAHGKVGEEIPEGLYVAVAQVLAYVYQMDMFAKGRGPKPERKPDMPIPRDLKINPDGSKA
ncbi:flagellar biosynthesis protein FlhB [Bacterioplanes sanyensis]|uniref:Flagellar biosynthetic protein FlhB n=1 Tax=Bacterioplanes sanyensis TaxID=1249553 RepID=A0A222FPX2_9GAMM|nr:flagellar biosynthesis protein FlhB [Bacterioplanes sanyensis]ASP40576.1 flagellar biosynthesis protein FlhB [Bacterioplanes sanyensis]